MVNFENGQLPVFTATNRIFDKGIIKDPVPFMAMKGQDLLHLTKGATLILNPFSEYRKTNYRNEQPINGRIVRQTMSL